MISTLLQQAIDGLHIQDVYLRWTQSQCNEGFRPQDADFSALHVQQMHVVKQVKIFEIEGDGKLLQVSVLLGMRWVIPAVDNEEPEIKALVEAEFIAEYRFANEVTQEGVDEFAQKNVIYHIWPYWREFLSTQTERLRLPRVTLETIQLPHHRLQNRQDNLS